jgi:hypothetical protein
MAEAAAAIVKRRGMLFIISTSTESHRFLASLRGWQLIESRKQFGYRALLLKRSGP